MGQVFGFTSHGLLRQTSTAVCEAATVRKTGALRLANFDARQKKIENEIELNGASSEAQCKHLHTRSTHSNGRKWAWRDCHALAVSLTSSSLSFMHKVILLERNKSPIVFSKRKLFKTSHCICVCMLDGVCVWESVRRGELVRCHHRRECSHHRTPSKFRSIAN